MSVRKAISTIGHVIECTDPATGQQLSHVPVMSRDEVVARVETSRRAQLAWGASSFRARRRVLRRLLDIVVANQDEICRLAVQDSGKTMVDAALGEIFPVAEKIRYTLKNGERDLRPQRRQSGLLPHKAAKVVYEPLGVIGIICPWNFPFHNILCPLVPALFAGNGVVVKISEWSSHSAERYIGMVRDALEAEGFSGDLIQYVTGYGETGSALVTSGADKIFFTGSPQNGRKVMAAASETLTPVVLELGGKDPFIVCEDADLQHAISQAMFGVYTACGQMCVGAERFYVRDEIYDEFVSEIALRVRRLRQGPPLGDTLVDCGATTMPRQLEILDDLVTDAVQKGARAVVGGRRSELGGQFYEPTVLVDVDHSMRITQEEQFGPVMVIMRVRSDDEAVQLANDCAYGLGATVFTRDKRRGEALAARIRSGMVNVNDYGLAYMMQSLPFGGIGVSGFGRINGREGLRACCHTKAVVTDRIPVGGGVSVYPVQSTTFGVVESVVSLIYAQGVRARARAAANLGRGLIAEIRARR